MGKPRRSFEFLWAAAFSASMGLIVFSGVASNPRFQTIHTFDVLRLMIAGAAVPVTIMLLAEFLIRGSHSKDKRSEEERGEESN